MLDYRNLIWDVNAHMTRHFYFPYSFAPRGEHSPGASQCRQISPKSRDNSTSQFPHHNHNHAPTPAPNPRQIPVSPHKSRAHIQCKTPHSSSPARKLTGQDVIGLLNSTQVGFRALEDRRRTGYKPGEADVAQMRGWLGQIGYSVRSLWTSSSPSSHLPSLSSLHLAPYHYPHQPPPAPTNNRSPPTSPASTPST